MILNYSAVLLNFSDVHVVNHENVAQSTMQRRMERRGGDSIGRDNKIRGGIGNGSTMVARSEERYARHEG